MTAVFLDSTLWLQQYGRTARRAQKQRYGRRGACGSSSMAGGSKLNDYIDDSFKANSDDDSGDGRRRRRRRVTPRRRRRRTDDGDEIEEPKLLPHSLSTAPLLALVGGGGTRCAGSGPRIAPRCLRVAGVIVAGAVVRR